MSSKQKSSNTSSLQQDLPLYREHYQKNKIAHRRMNTRNRFTCSGYSFFCRCTYFYQGCMAPKRTSQARMDFATRLRMMYTRSP